MEEGIELGSSWEHNTEHYTVTIQTPPNLVVKDDNASAWRTAVAYTRDDDEDEYMFVRSEEDFKEKFSVVEH